MSGVKVSWGQSVFGVKMSFFGSGSKCLWGQSVSGVKMSSGSKFLGVKVSLGSKCRWGQSVFGVKMGVSPFGRVLFFSSDFMKDSWSYFADAVIFCKNFVGGGF